MHFFGLLSTMTANIFLDYVFIARLDWGLKGAALATGFAFLVCVLVVLPHFLRDFGRIKFVRP